MIVIRVAALAVADSLLLCLSLVSGILAIPVFAVVIAAVAVVVC